MPSPLRPSQPVSFFFDPILHFGLVISNHISMLFTGCVDLLNPATGYSDCQQKYACSWVILSFFETHFQILHTKTARLSHHNFIVNGSICRSALCRESRYSLVMAVQCPRTCGLCPTLNANDLALKLRAFRSKFYPPFAHILG